MYLDGCILNSSNIINCHYLILYRYAFYTHMLLIIVGVYSSCFYHYVDVTFIMNGDCPIDEVECFIFIHTNTEYILFI